MEGRAPCLGQGHGRPHLKGGFPVESLKIVGKISFFSNSITLRNIYF